MSELARSASNWDLAVKRIIREVDLVCPRCSAMNRPSATMIELNERGLAYCGVCAYAWHPRPDERVTFRWR